MSTYFRISALFFVLATACHSGPPGDTVPADQTRARIENQNSVDMDIYVRRSDGRVSRLGFVPANENGADGSGDAGGSRGSTGGGFTDYISKAINTGTFPQTVARVLGVNGRS